ncbi:MAG: hypothetical protein ACYDAG_00955, partial [Chloroflexota bacterium]
MEIDDELGWAVRQGAWTAVRTVRKVLTGRADVEQAFAKVARVAMEDLDAQRAAGSPHTRVVGDQDDALPGIAA